MPGSDVEEILVQTRRTTALTNQQVFALTRLPKRELCALAIVLARWRAAIAPERHALTKRLKKSKPINEPDVLPALTPGELYVQLVSGEALLPDQLIAVRDWSLPNLLAWIVILQSDLIESSKVVPFAGTNSGSERLGIAVPSRARTAGRYRPRRRSRRIVRERWIGAAVAVAYAIALPFLSISETGRAVVQASTPFVIGAASFWLYSQGRWLAHSQSDTKVIAGRIAISTAALGCLLAAGLILAELARAGLSIGASLLEFAAFV